MTQTEFTLTALPVSQADIILDLLERQRGEWLAMPYLVQESGSYNVHSRISDLRARGITIEHRNEREKGCRAVKSFYRVV